MEYEVKLRRLEAQPVLGVEAETPIEGIPGVLQDAFPVAYEYAGTHGAAPAGPPFVWYDGAPQDGRVKLFAGVPVQARAAGEGRVEARELPGGEVLVVEHFGPYEQLEAAYAAMERWAVEHGRALGQGMWEVYWTDPSAEPDPAKWRTEVFWPLE